MDKVVAEPQYWYTKGLKYYNEKRYGIAIRCFDKYLDFNQGENYLAWFMKGNSFYQLQEYTEAVYCFNKSIFN